jgi:hypothetical protein
MSRKDESKVGTDSPETASHRAKTLVSIEVVDPRSEAADDGGRHPRWPNVGSRLFPVGHSNFERVTSCASDF